MKRIVFSPRHRTPVKRSGEMPKMASPTSLRLENNRMASAAKLVAKPNATAPRARSLAEKIPVEHKNQTLLLLGAFVFLAGMVVGVLMARQADDRMLQQIDLIFANSYQSRLNQTIWFIFSSSLASSFLFVLASFLMGLSIWGCALVWALPLLRGIGAGVSSGYLYAQFGFQGVLFHFLIMIPGMLIATVAILLSTRESFQMSFCLLRKGLMEKGKESINQNFRLFLARHGVILMFIVASAACDTLLSTVFSGLFHF